jgi:sugar/nucleoside kinase (ribokinase family)
MSAASPSLDIFVIGTVSLDVLHLANGQTVHAAGGAGMYTALAAHHAGARVGLFAPRPEPMPELLQPIANRLYWLGPVISPENLPHLEIAHHGGGRATLLHASWGAEARLTAETMPGEVVQTPIIHIAALSTVERQLDFLQTIRKSSKGAEEQRSRGEGKSLHISVGTYARLVYSDTKRVRRLFELADFFFMNENEANGLFGSVDKARTQPDALLFVTQGEAGALVIEGEQVTHVPGQPAPELDPTGAGDTFCGATLAGLVQGRSPGAAAARAVTVAAQTVGAVGPGALLGKY